MAPSARRRPARRPRPARSGGESAPKTAALAYAERSYRGADLAWLGVVPVALVFLASTWAVAPALGGIVSSSSEGQTFFASSQMFVKPEPTEFARYLLAVVFAGLLAVWVLALTPKVVGRWRPSPAIDLAIVGSQAAALVMAAVAVVAQFRVPSFGASTTIYFSWWNLAGGVVVATGLAAVARRRLLPIGRVAPPSRATALFGLVVAVLVTSLWLMPAVYTDANLGLALDEVLFHVQFTFGELLVVPAGRSPLVDFIPQYSALLPYVLGPIITALGATVSAFTLVMAALSLAGLLGVYGVFATVTRDWRTALLLYVPFLGLTLYTVRFAGDQRFNFANYYAVMPLRYVAPFVVAFLCARSLAGRRAGASVALFVVAGLATLNNIEFGLPALVAAMAAAWFGHAGTGFLRPALAVLGRAAAGAAIATGAVVVYILVRTAELPRPGYLLYWSRFFAASGFNLLPMPPVGFHLLLLATFVAALATAAVRRSRQAPDRVLTGMLAFSAIFGLGTGAYFVGRSYAIVLPALFAAWGLALALLAWTVVVRLATAGRPRRRTVERALLPATAVLVGFGLMVTTLSQFPNPLTQLDRLGRGQPTDVLDRTPSRQFVEETTSPGTRVLLLDPLGHEVARQAGVDDLSLFASPLQIISEDQVEDLLQVLEDAGGFTVFTGRSLAPEVAPMLEANDFSVAATDQDSGMTKWVKSG